jgi:ubiquitin-conjugating enzyme (huntingtin interacting protein 2)
MSSATGAICLDILKDQWAAALTLRTVLLSIQALLAAPEPDDPQDAVVASQFKTNKQLFDRVARYWSVEHAGAEHNEETKEMEVILCKVLDMGFTKSRAIVALSQNNWKLEDAIQWLSDQ